MKHDPEYLKSIFERTQILRKPISGIVAGYHILPYILVGAQEGHSRRSVEIRGKIRVSPRLVISPGGIGQTYGELFDDPEIMDRALLARVFSFALTPRHNVVLESEELRITKSDQEPRAQITRALDDLAHREIINTGVILTPDIRCYPVSIDRFITEILDEEFRIG